MYSLKLLSYYDILKSNKHENNVFILLFSVDFGITNSC